MCFPQVCHWGYCEHKEHCLRTGKRIRGKNAAFKVFSFVIGFGGWARVSWLLVQTAPSQRTWYNHFFFFLQLFLLVLWLSSPAIPQPRTLGSLSIGPCELPLCKQVCVPKVDVRSLSTEISVQISLLWPLLNTLVERWQTGYSRRIWNESHKFYFDMFWEYTLALCRKSLVIN